jgi:hypothetical protein
VYIISLWKRLGKIIAIWHEVKKKKEMYDCEKKTIAVMKKKKKIKKVKSYFDLRS